MAREERCPPDRSHAAFHRFDRLRAYCRKGRAPSHVVNGRMVFLTVDETSSRGDQRVDRQTFHQSLRSAFKDEIVDEAACGFSKRYPAETARTIKIAGPASIAIVVAFIAAAIIIAGPAPVFAALVLLSTIMLVGFAVLRLALVLIARKGIIARPQTCLADADLPVITILAPLFREAFALPGLIRALGRLDYPRDKLDIKLLLEEGDTETIRECATLQLGAEFDVNIIPKGSPQTKPRACNFGLATARGDLIVIYDAEDEPEPSQLREAAGLFAASDDGLACVQAQLNYHNPDENLLTRLFTLEYCLWFDHLLPALDRLGAPVPLGGTSNIFRTDSLVEVGGWDAHNVTEDADLGLRLARRGFRTAVISSTTYEEANCRVGNWLRQRTRWMKGFLQSWMVHRRADRRAPFSWKTVMTADLFIGGAVFAALLNPVLWAVLLLEKLNGLAPLAPLPDWAGQSAQIGLIAANILFIALAAYAPLRRSLWRLSPAALLMPLYWLLMSVAAWRGLFQLMTRPSFWEKTDHGISQESLARREAALAALSLEQNRAARQISSRTGAPEVARAAAKDDDKE